MEIIDLPKNLQPSNSQKRQFVVLEEYRNYCIGYTTDDKRDQKTILVFDPKRISMYIISKDDGKPLKSKTYDVETNTIDSARKYIDWLTMERRQKSIEKSKKQGMALAKG